VKNVIRKALGSGGWVSGQKLAEMTGASRAAVWKHIRSLRQEGYEISSASGRGYKLDKIPDHLLLLEIQDGLRTKLLGSRIVYKQEVESTQLVLKAMAAEGTPEGTAVLAEHQTKGRGRLHRSWSSPPGNIAMSVLLRPEIAPRNAFGFPLLAGVAVVRAIKAACGLECGLKWPNDVVCREHKLGGVLIEMTADMDRVVDLFLGIGLNVNTPQSGLPQGLPFPATSVLAQKGATCPRVNLVQELLVQIEDLYTTFVHQGFEPVRLAWKETSITLGRQVQAMGPEGHTIEGLAEDIDAFGSLIIKTPAGEAHSVTSGDVTLRPQGLLSDPDGQTC